MIVGVLLALAAAAGALCIVLVLLAVFFHITLVMFKTGSMAPTIPAGSVAVVREIPASEIRVGDVVTVERVDGLPVTHRVTAISGDGVERTITLRGDANQEDDPQPYHVTTVRLTLFAIPGLAPFIVWLGNPLVLGGITLGAAILVTWAFWPRTPKGGGAGGGSSRDRGGDPAGEPPPRRGGAKHSAGAIALILLTCAIGWQVVGPAEPARAADSVDVIQGSVLRLTSIRDLEAMATMSAGTPVAWQVGVEASTSEPGTVTVSMRSEAQSSSFQSEVSSCGVRWEDDTCPTGAVLVQPSAPVENGSEITLAAMPVSEQLWFLVTVWVDAAAAQGSSATLILNAEGAGDAVSTNETAGLAGTGFAPLATIGVVAGIFVVGVLLVLIAVVAARRRRTR